MKFAVFAFVPALIAGVGIYGVWVLTASDPVEQTFDIIQVAWESSYTERDLLAPSSGPRDGYWSSKVSPKPKHPITGWIEPEYKEPGILEIDEFGMQHFVSARAAQLRAGQVKILIVGGSVASGTYASSANTTYFHQLGTMLEADQIDCHITVFAAGAWKSSQDVAAFEHFVSAFGKPDLVIFINGLNDLTNGANAEVLYNERVETKTGEPWTSEYHEHDYDQRVRKYLSTMGDAVRFAKARDIDVIVALQPALFEKRQLTIVEQRLLRDSVVFHKNRSPSMLAKSYEDIRKGLYQLASEEEFSFVDCSRIFHTDSKTIFTDLWHFADVGHRKLANYIDGQVRDIAHQRIDRLEP